MELLSNVRWPWSLGDYLQGITPMTVPDRTGTVLSKTEYVDVHPDDLRWCRPTNAVTNYADLVELVAKLAGFNTQYELFFRGHRDIPRRPHGFGNTITPTIWRKDRIIESFEDRKRELAQKSDRLLECYRSDRQVNPDSRIVRLMQENPLIQWSLLQHYRVCDTPLLDITPSLRVATSFALEERKTGFLYIFALPHRYEAVTTNNHQGTINISLLGVAPPNAQRPHYQEGFLACSSQWWGMFANGSYAFREDDVIDFADRLIAIIKISNESGEFWESGTSGAIQSSRLYPAGDKFLHFLKRHDFKPDAQLAKAS